MNIGIFMHAYLPKIGGAQITTHCLANSLSRMGHNITIYTNPDLVKSCESLGWEFRYALKGLRCPKQKILNWSMNGWLYLAGKLIKGAIKRDNLDIVQLIGAWPWLPAAKKIKNAGVPAVVRSSGDDIQVDNSIEYGIRRNHRRDVLIRKGFISISKAIAISPTVTGEYTDIGVSKKDIVEIVPGVDFKAFSDCRINKAEIREKWNIPVDKRMIISVGRNHPKKGFRDLVKALKCLNKNGGEFVAVIVGKGTDELAPEARKLGQGQNYIPVNEVASLPANGIDTFPSLELIELYKASDYFVLPSYIETYANVAVEAMAAGTPVIVTNAPGCIDTIKDGEDGLIVPRHSPEKIAESIVRLENERDLRDKIVDQGIRRAARQDWENIAREYLQVYESLV